MPAIEVVSATLTLQARDGGTVVMFVRSVDGSTTRHMLSLNAAASLEKSLVAELERSFKLLAGRMSDEARAADPDHPHHKFISLAPNPNAHELEDLGDAEALEEVAVEVEGGRVKVEAGSPDRTEYHAFIMVPEVAAKLLGLLGKRLGALRLGQPN